ncbi:hypothetical protein [Sulfitobacter sp. R18_1]|uniref:hypothetical protein n=1 Tax=Sulfitobacter sp. R18_1 TaxID=2821104 RepID=UPI001ADAC505|nr:hypothetical protein [Sulfitobacter sp. R18_1]MBO9428508.1 hypothetical protein [Sulfitobacter sp. R18_1]
MANTNWIMGKSVDARMDVDLSECDKFIGYMVKLDSPRCLIAVGEIGLGEENVFDLPENAGWRYANYNAGFELTILEWLDDVAVSVDGIQNTLYEAATNHVLATQDEMAASGVDAQE